MKKILYGIIAVLGVVDLYGADANPDRRQVGKRLYKEINSLDTQEEKTALLDSLNDEDRAAVCAYTQSKMSIKDHVLASIRSVITREIPRIEWVNTFTEQVAASPTNDKAIALSLSLFSLLDIEEMSQLGQTLETLVKILDESGRPDHVPMRNIVNKSVTTVFSPLAQLKRILDEEVEIDSCVSHIANEILEEAQKEILAEPDKDEEDAVSTSARNLLVVALKILPPNRLLQLREELISIVSIESSAVQDIIQHIVREFLDSLLPYEMQVDFAFQSRSDKDIVQNIILRIGGNPLLEAKRALFNIALQRLPQAGQEELASKLLDKLTPAEQIEAISELCTTSRNKVQAIAALIGAQRYTKDRQTVLITAWRELPKTEKDLLRKELVKRGLTKASAAQKK